MAVIGDQIFTDVLGAKRAGCKAFLVNPRGIDESPWFSIGGGSKLLLYASPEIHEREPMKALFGPAGNPDNFIEALSKLYCQDARLARRNWP